MLMSPDPFSLGKGRRRETRVYACSREKLLQAAVHTLTVLRSEFWLLFRARAKGIMFYDVPVSYVKEELRFRCELEPFNTRNV